MGSQEDFNNPASKRCKKNSISPRGFSLSPLSQIQHSLGSLGLGNLGSHTNVDLSEDQPPNAALFLPFRDWANSKISLNVREVGLSIGQQGGIGSRESSGGGGVSSRRESSFSRVESRWNRCRRPGRCQQASCVKLCVMDSRRRGNVIKKQHDETNLRRTI